jgi:hypothetical protein
MTSSGSRTAFPSFPTYSPTGTSTSSESAAPSQSAASMTPTPSITPSNSPTPSPSLYISATSSPGSSIADVEKPVVVTFAFVVSGSALTSTTISNPIVVKTVKSQWASLLGVSSSSVYVRFVTDLSTGITSGPFGPNDSINQGRRQRRLKKTFDTDKDESIKDNGSGPLGKQMQLDKARYISSSRRILAGGATSGISVGMAVNLASSSGNPSDDVALVKAHSITNIANNAALASSVFGPIASSVAVVSGASASSINFKVDESSVSVSNLQRDIVINKVEPLAPGIQAAIVIFVVVGSMVLYIYVLKPLRIRFHSFLSKHITCLKTLSVNNEVKVSPIGVSQGLAASVAPSEAKWVMANIEQIRIAAEQGNAGAQAQLGRRMLYGVGGCEKNPRGATEWLERAARSKQREKRRVIQGDSQSIQSLKSLYNSSDQSTSKHATISDHLEHTMEMTSRTSDTGTNLEHRADTAIKVFEAADAEIAAGYLISDSSASFNENNSMQSQTQIMDDADIVQQIIDQVENGLDRKTFNSQRLDMKFTSANEEEEEEEEDSNEMTFSQGAFRKPKSVATDAELRQRADLAQQRLRESGLGSVF